MREVKNILIIRPSALGDVCRSVCVLAALRRAYPEARIDWLVQKEFGDAIWHHPALSEPVLFERREMGRGLLRGRPGSFLSLVGKLRRGAYDLVIDAQGLARSGIFARFSGATRRIGYAAPEAREMSWIWYSTRVRVDSGAHAVERMMALAEAAGCDEKRDLRLYTGPVERQWVKGALPGRGSSDSMAQYVVVAPTSRWPGKRWGADRFASLAAALLDQVGRVAVVGAGSERDQCGALLELAQRDERVVDLVGKTGVGQLMALVEGASLVVGNDSAVLHMAVGFDRPLVGLYGPTDVKMVGPYGREGDVIQHVRGGERLDHKNEALGRAMMERISVAEVVEACRGHLAGAAGSRPAPRGNPASAEEPAPPGNPASP